MDERFSTLNGDLMTDSMMLEEFNRLVQETPTLDAPEMPVFEAPKVQKPVAATAPTARSID